MKIRIITDSASDLSQKEYENVTILPMTVTFSRKEYRDGVDLSHKKFYELLIEEDDLPTTSQVTPYLFKEAFKRSVENGERVIAVTIASRLSGTYQSACIAAAEYPDNVTVIDSGSASIGEGILVRRAVELTKQNLEYSEIIQKLNTEKKEISLIALLDTLEYLKRGGRLSKQTAAIGTMLSIKPVATIDDGEIKILGKARGSKNGNNLLIREVEKTNGIDFLRPYALGYTGLTDSTLQKYINDSRALWQNYANTLPVYTIGGTIGTHVGPGTISVAFFHKTSAV